MEFTGLALLMEKGTPVILLALLVLSVVNTIFIRFLCVSVDSIKINKLWSDKYEADQRTQLSEITNIKDRIDRLENAANGKRGIV